MVAAVICIVVIVAVIVVWYIAACNGIKVMKLKVDEAKSGIDIALVKRYDVLKKMLDVVKEYERYEKSTLLEAIDLRQTKTMAQRNDVSSKMDEFAAGINVVAEAYPELKSSENFGKLQSAISDTEEHLQAARRLYNSNVTAYNTKIVTFPSSIAANAMNMNKEEYFEGEAKKLQDVEMTF